MSYPVRAPDRPEIPPQAVSTDQPEVSESSELAVRDMDFSLGAHKERSPENRWRGGPGVHGTVRMTAGLAEPRTQNVFGRAFTRDATVRLRADVGPDGIARMDAHATPVDLFRDPNGNGTGWGMNVEVGLGSYSSLYDVSANSATHLYGRYARPFGERFTFTAEAKAGLGVDHTRSSLGNHSHTVRSTGFSFGLASELNSGRISTQLYRTQRDNFGGGHRHAMAGMEARYEPRGTRRFYRFAAEKDAYSTTGRDGPTYRKDAVFMLGAGVRFR